MESRQDLVLVTGVTGKQGGAIAGELVAKGVRVRGMTRGVKNAMTKYLILLVGMEGFKSATPAVNRRPSLTPFGVRP